MSNAPTGSRNTAAAQDAHAAAIDTQHCIGNDAATPKLLQSELERRAGDKAVLTVFCQQLMCPGKSLLARGALVSTLGIRAHKISDLITATG